MPHFFAFKGLNRYYQIIARKLKIFERYLGNLEIVRGILLAGPLFKFFMEQSQVLNVEPSWLKNLKYSSLKL